MRFEPTLTRGNGEPCGTLCERCQRAVAHGDFGCSWSQDFIPVENWCAVPTIVMSGDIDDELEFSSYCVLECPQFLADKPRKPFRSTNYISTHTRTKQERAAAKPESVPTRSALRGDPGAPFCRYNVMINCAREHRNECATCGWCPEVSRERRIKLKEVL